MGSRVALILLSLVSPLLLVVLMFGSGGVLGLGVPLICGVPVLLIIVGTESRRPAPLGLLALWLLLSCSWLAIDWLSATQDLQHPSVTLATAVLGLMLLGLGLIPLILVAWLCARSMDDTGLSPADLERLRRVQR